MIFFSYHCKRTIENCHINMMLASHGIGTIQLGTFRQGERGPV